MPVGKSQDSPAEVSLHQNLTNSQIHQHTLTNTIPEPQQGPTPLTKTLQTLHPHLVIHVLVILLLLFLAGCSAKSGHQILYIAQQDTQENTISAPRFLVNAAQHSYNKIGTPAYLLQDLVSGDSDPLGEVIVSPDKATLYYDTDHFSTKSDSYRNAIYRIHFEKVPFGFPLPNLTTGKNPGLLIIYTYNDNEELILITSLHTCGCYLAFIPTDKMPKAYYPTDWPTSKTSRQWVYGHSLPAYLPLETQESKSSIVFTLEDETHRISNITTSTPKGDYKLLQMHLAQLKELYSIEYLTTNGKRSTGDVSFFELEGSRRGYVKNNIKILERLLIGWWALDWRVGEDKAYGTGDNSEVPLYTSLKYWAREESDIKDFRRFLKYWGWRL